MKVLILSIASFVGFYYFYYKIWNAAFVFASVSFSWIVILLTMKIQCRSNILSFFGQHVFSVYMLQRLVLLIVAKRIDNRYFCFIFCLIVTATISVAFDNIIANIERKAISIW